MIRRARFTSKNQLKAPVIVHPAARFFLDPYEFMVYAALAHFTNPKKGCYPSLETLARETGIHIDTVKKCRNSMRAIGFLSWKTVKKPVGQGKRCIYYLPLETGSESKKQKIIDRVTKGDLITRVQSRPRGITSTRKVYRENT